MGIFNSGISKAERRLTRLIIDVGNMNMNALKRIVAAVEGLRGDLARKDEQLVAAEARAAAAEAAAAAAQADASSARSDAQLARGDLQAATERLAEVSASLAALDLAVDELEKLDMLNQPEDVKVPSMGDIPV